MELLRTAYAWYAGHKEVFEISALCLTVIGTAFAVQSIRDGNKLTRDLRAVFDHLSTRAIGAWPSYMPEIERVISEARDSLLIVCDYPGYGVWQDRGRYSAYVKALEDRKADRVRRSRPFSVRIVCMDAVRRADELEKRYPEETFKKYVKEGSFPKSRRLYEELENCRVPETRSGFLAEMIARQNRAVQADLRFAEVRESNAVLPIHFWIADGEKAVFVIPGGGGADFGFATEEAGLVQGLLSIGQRCFDEAAEAQSNVVDVSTGRKRA